MQPLGGTAPAATSVTCEHPRGRSTAGDGGTLEGASGSLARERHYRIRCTTLLSHGLPVFPRRPVEPKVASHPRTLADGELLDSGARQGHPALRRYAVSSRMPQSRCQTPQDTKLTPSSGTATIRLAASDVQSMRLSPSSASLDHQTTSYDKVYIRTRRLRDRPRFLGVQALKR